MFLKLQGALFDFVHHIPNQWENFLNGLFHDVIGFFDSANQVMESQFKLILQRFGKKLEWQQPFEEILTCPQARQRVITWTFLIKFFPGPASDKSIM